MIVPISQGCSSDDHPPEWGMIELNGEIVYPQQFDHDKENNNDVVGENRVELGSLRFSDKGVPTMIVGSHELKGKVVMLKQPFVVMKKKKKALPRKILEGGVKEDDGQVEYEALGVVSKKLLFDEYPKSIMR